MSAARVPGSPAGGLPAGTGLVAVTGAVGRLAVAGVDFALGSTEQYWAAQAAAKLGLAPKNLFGRFIDFDDGARLRATNSGAAPSPGLPNLDGGWHSYTGGDDTNAGTLGLAATNLFSSLAPKHVANCRTSPWYIVARWKTTTVPGATARSTIGLGTTGLLRAGIVKASHATKFCAVWTGAVLASTISFDTAIHEVMVRNDGTNVYLSVDGEAEVSAAVGSLSTSDGELFFEIAAGALEAKQTYQIDYMGIWTGRSS
jgi:hypothetical protein